MSTSTYRICKDKKSGILVFPEEVTVIASVEDKNKDLEPSFQSPLHASTSTPSDAGSQSSFVTSDQLKQISDQWAEQFAHFEAFYQDETCSQQHRLPLNLSLLPLPGSPVRWMSRQRLS